MKSTSKVIMAATLVMVVSLAMVLGLVLVLLAELYCSLLLRRRRRSLTLPTTSSVAVAVTASASADPAASHPQEAAPSQSVSPLSSFYSHGVLQAPTSFLFPVSFSQTNIQTKTHLSESHQVLDEPAVPNSPELICEIQIQPSVKNAENDKPTSCVGGEHFVYISNPIYSNEATSKPDTPFETPDSSPSRLEICGLSSGEDDDEETAGGGAGSPAGTPPLTPMKNLPEKACSVSLRDAMSLETSGSDSNSNNGGSSSSSRSPCTSPSW